MDQVRRRQSQRLRKKYDEDRRIMLVGTHTHMYAYLSVSFSLTRIRWLEATSSGGATRSSTSLRSEPRPTLQCLEKRGRAQTVTTLKIISQYSLFVAAAWVFVWKREGRAETG